MANSKRGLLERLKYRRTWRSSRRADYPYAQAATEEPTGPWERLNRSESTLTPGGPMSESGHSRRFGIGRESAYPQIPDILGARFIRREVPIGDLSRCSKLRGQNCGYSMTSSARRRIDVGNSMPIAFAVLRLIAVSKLVTCSTGRSAGFAPRRTLAT
jgi:hypothetical protein